MALDVQLLYFSIIFPGVKQGIQSKHKNFPGNNYVIWNQLHKSSIQTHAKGLLGLCVDDMLVP